MQRGLAMLPTVVFLHFPVHLVDLRAKELEVAQATLLTRRKLLLHETVAEPSRPALDALDGHLKEAGKGRDQEGLVFLAGEEEEEANQEEDEGDESYDKTAATSRVLLATAQRPS